MHTSRKLHHHDMQNEGQELILQGSHVQQDTSNRDSPESWCGRWRQQVLMGDAPPGQHIFSSHKLVGPM